MAHLRSVGREVEEEDDPDHDRTVECGHAGVRSSVDAVVHDLQHMDPGCDQFTQLLAWVRTTVDGVRAKCAGGPSSDCPVWLLAVEEDIESLVAYAEEALRDAQPDEADE